MSKREDIVKSMKKNFADFRKRYGEKAKSVMYATATKQAMDEEQETDEEEFYSEHLCAQHVYHDVYGEGVVVENEHDTPDEDGNIAWYTVEFAHGKETVYTEDVEIMMERYHGHMMKKKKMAEEVEDLEEGWISNISGNVKRKDTEPQGDKLGHQEYKIKHAGQSVKFKVPYEGNAKVGFTHHLSKIDHEGIRNHLVKKYGPTGGKRPKGLPSAGYTEIVKGAREHMEKNSPTNEAVEQQDEALVGNQHKIDMNKNNKIDAHDFKLLRKIKQTRKQ